MKTLLTLLFVSTLALGATAQNEKYLTTMEKAISELYAANDIETLNAITNRFMRIGQAEKTQWEPFYYASLSQVFKGFKMDDLTQKDAVLDAALEAIMEADNLSPNNSEVVALTGFIYMIKIGIDPGTRGQTLSPKIFALFERAKNLDPANPRATLFLGQMEVGTAQFFGKGLPQACELINSSLALFDTFKPANSLSPMWGRSTVANYTTLCSETKDQ